MIYMGYSCPDGRFCAFLGRNKGHGCPSTQSQPEPREATLSSQLRGTVPSVSVLSLMQKADP